MSEKCTLVIESSPFVTRWALSADSGGRIGETIYDLVGYRSPGYTKEERKFSWTRLGEQYEWYVGEDVSAGRHSKMETPEALWGRLLREGAAAGRREGASELAQALIPEITGSEAFRKFTEDDGLAVEGLVFLVPEYLDGPGQEYLHRALARVCRGLRIGEANIFLLFRSAALALAHIKESKPEKGQGLLVLDCGHYWYEASRLDVVEKDGTLLPRRSFRAAKGLGNCSLETLGEVLRRGYHTDHTGSCGAEQIKLHQVVHEGLELPDLLEFDEERLCYKTLSPSSGDRQIPSVAGLADHISQYQELDHGGRQQQTYRPMQEYLGDKASDAGLLHGWPSELGSSEGLPFCASEPAVLGSNAALRGGIEFAERQRAGKPTYLERIPRFEIYLHEEARYDDETPLIEGRYVDGAGRREREENNSFRVREGADFQCGIRVLDEAVGEEVGYEARCVEVKEPEEEVEVTVEAEIRPMAGGIRFTIKPRRPDGPTFKPVRLNWDAAPPFELPTRSYPRTIEYAGEERQRDELLRIIGGSSGPDGDLLGSTLGRHRSRVKNILHPNMKNEYEVAFGSERVEDLDGRLVTWVRQLNEAAANELRSPTPDYGLVELAGDTFAHALPEFREAMAQRMLERGAMGENNLSCWAFGRICDRPEWLEAFISRFLAPEEAGRFDSKRYQVIWPFQKSLALYEDVARISEEAGYKMFAYLERTLSQVVGRSLPRQDFAPGNARKWVLSAILFGLRIRAHHPRFLDPDEGEDSMAMRLCALVEEVPVRVPSLALKQASYEGSLSDIVIRFIKREATEVDDAIVGGIGRS